MKIVSGIRPTGVLHLGNYLGAIKNWIPLQEQNECLFFLADLHALTTAQGTDIKKNTYTTAATYLACGIKPGSIFIQSQIHEHAELGWLLSCHTPLGWLNRMTQFKEKAENKEKACLGLYAYPTLMAADVLLYHATHVPVGEDQKQHVELIRDIAISINHKYEKEIFTVPEPIIQKVGARIMSLRDSESKMGKSNTSDFERINLLDSNDLINEKIKKAVSDSFPLPSTLEELEIRKEAKNLLTIFSLITPQTLEQTITQFAGQNFSILKKELGEAMVNIISPIREKIELYLKDISELNQILKQGLDKAHPLAQKTLRKTMEALRLE